jgi:hypothetical protein
LKKSTGGNKIVEILGDLKKYEIWHGDRFEYLPQLSDFAL